MSFVPLQATTASPWWQQQVDLSQQQDDLHRSAASALGAMDASYFVSTRDSQHSRNTLADHLAAADLLAASVAANATEAQASMPRAFPPHVIVTSMPAPVEAAPAGAANLLGPKVAHESAVWPPQLQSAVDQEAACQREVQPPFVPPPDLLELLEPLRKECGEAERRASQASEAELVARGTAQEVALQAASEMNERLVVMATTRAWEQEHWKEEMQQLTCQLEHVEQRVRLHDHAAESRASEEERGLRQAEVEARDLCEEARRAATDESARAAAEAALHAATAQELRAATEEANLLIAAQRHWEERVEQLGEELVAVRRTEAEEQCRAEGHLNISRWQSSRLEEALAGFYSERLHAAEFASVERKECQEAQAELQAARAAIAEAKRVQRDAARNDHERILTLEEDVERLTLVSRRAQHNAVEEEAQADAMIAAAAGDRAYSAGLRAEADELGGALAREAALAAACEEAAEWDRRRRMASDEAMDAALAQQALLFEELVSARATSAELSQEVTQQQKERSRDLGQFAAELRRWREEAERLHGDLDLARIRAAAVMDKRESDVLLRSLDCKLESLDDLLNTPLVALPPEPGVMPRGPVEKVDLAGSTDDNSALDLGAALDAIGTVPVGVGLASTFDEPSPERRREPYATTPLLLMRTSPLAGWLERDPTLSQRLPCDQGRHGSAATPQLQNPGTPIAAAAIATATAAAGSAGSLAAAPVAALMPSAAVAPGAGASPGGAGAAAAAAVGGILPHAEKACSPAALGDEGDPFASIGVRSLWDD